MQEHQVYEHLTHLERSIAHGRLACGYTFEDRERLNKPGRCPHGRATRASLYYRLRFVVSDRYDFTNKRPGEYHRYRLELATLLRANRFLEFNQRFFHDAAVPGGSHFVRTFGRTSLFASYMYALEARGWTGPGFSWEVVVPMTVQVRLVGEATAEPRRR